MTEVASLNIKEESSISLSNYSLMNYLNELNSDFFGDGGSEMDFYFIKNI